MKLLSSVYPGDDSVNLLQQWLSYYRRAGINEFHILMMPNPDQGHDSDVYDILRKSSDVVCVELPELVKSEQDRVDLYSKYKFEEMSDCRMVFAVDADEFVACPASLYEQACLGDFDYVRGRLVDRFAFCGETKEISLEDDIFAQFPLCSEFSWDALGALQSKTPLSKPSIAYGIGLHKVIEPERWSKPEWEIMVHHFKWTAGIIQKIRHRMERNRGEDQFIPEQYRKECEWFLENHVTNETTINLDDIDTWYQPNP